MQIVRCTYISTHQDDKMFNKVNENSHLERTPVVLTVLTVMKCQTVRGLKILS